MITQSPKLEETEFHQKFCFLSTCPDDTQREHEEKSEDKIRNAFDHDRDRILFSKEFRRLMGKTQVFVSSYDDHIRNRLTHTLEVAQISKTICKNLGLNETLAEAIAFGHDVGHTPFGHVGERILNHLTNNCDPFRDFNIENEKDMGFKHNWQSIKVVSSLEQMYPEHKGLNLTYATIWGILHHSKLNYEGCRFVSDGSYCNYQHRNIPCSRSDKLSVGYYEHNFSYLIKEEAWSYEAFIVGLSDEIAQRHHDIEDGIMAEILGKVELINKMLDIFQGHLTPNQKDTLEKAKNSTNLNHVIHDVSRIVIDLYREDVINAFLIGAYDLCQRRQVFTHQDFIDHKRQYFQEKNLNILTFSDGFARCDEKLQKFLMNRILNSHLAQSMDGKSSYILQRIIEAYLTNPKQLPDSTIISLFKKIDEELTTIDDPSKTTKQLAGDLRNRLSSLHFKENGPEYKASLIRTIVDFIAGMTDDFAMSQYRLLYGDKTINRFR